jgi:hypothetical protein
MPERCLAYSFMGHLESDYYLGKMLGYLIIMRLTYILVPLLDPYSIV